MQMQQCPHCGAAVPAGDRFCGECGRALSDVPAAPSPAASDTPAQPPAIPSWQPPPQPPAAPPAWQPQANPLAAATGTQNLASRENLAIASLVLGVINLCSWSIPLCGVPLAVAGLALGAYALNSRNRTLALVGVALSGLGLVVSLLNAFLGFVNML